MLDTYMALVAEIRELEARREDALSTLVSSSLGGDGGSRPGISDPTGSVGLQLWQQRVEIDQRKAQAAALRQKIEDALKSLPPLDGEIVKLHCFEGWSMRVIAERLFGGRPDYAARRERYRTIVRRKWRKTLEFFNGAAKGLI